MNKDSLRSQLDQRAHGLAAHRERRIQFEEAGLNNTRALETVKVGLGEIDKRPRSIILDKVDHPALGSGTVEAWIDYWGKTYSGEVVQKHKSIPGDRVVTLNEAIAIRISYNFLPDEEGPDSSFAHQFATELYGPVKDIEYGGELYLGKEIYFSDGKEALGASMRRQVEAAKTVALLKSAAADPELNPELASRFTAA